MVIHKAGIKALTPFVVLIAVPAACAWLALAVLLRNDSLTAMCLAPRQGLQQVLLALYDQALLEAGSNGFYPCILFMTVAMALPLALLPAMRVTATAFDSKRLLQCSLYLTAYVVTWLMVMAPLAIIGRIVPSLLHLNYPHVPWSLIALFCVVAHRLSPEAQTALKHCHRISPIRVFTPAAQFDVVDLGRKTALRCARLCWPAMLLPWFVTRPIATMVGTTVLAVTERHSLRPSRTILCLVFFAITCVEFLFPTPY